jgi:hypothetical protein
MISRQFRAFNVGGFSVNSITDRPNGEVRTLSEFEQKCVHDMEVMYRKLICDEIYLEGLDIMETRIQSMKIELNHLINQKHDLAKMCNHLRPMLQPVVLMDEHATERLSYFIERHEDVSIRCRVLNEKIKSLSCRMVGMCYWPLISAMKSIMNYHSRVCNNDICQLKCGPYFILSNILLLILCNCDLEVFPIMTKFASKWSVGNICSHPIIKMMESKVDEQMYWQRNITIETPVELVKSISTNVFESYEILYLEWIVINMISTYLKYNHRYNLNLKIILSINGIGMLIYGFLITEEKVLSLLAKLRVSRKRKLD